jgi:hypothetical protein
MLSRAASLKFVGAGDYLSDGTDDILFETSSRALNERFGRRRS